MNFWQWAGDHPLLFLFGGVGTMYFVGITLDGVTNIVKAWREKK